MATCTVTFTTDKAAVSGAVSYRPLPNQMIGGVGIDHDFVYAQASGNDYVAVLQQGARYRAYSTRHAFTRKVFRVPETSTANLSTLIKGVKT
jgi:hypothetical protein